MVEYDTKLSHIRPLNQIYALDQSKAIEQPIGCSIAIIVFYLRMIYAVSCPVPLQILSPRMIYAVSCPVP